MNIRVHSRFVFFGCFFATVCRAENLVEKSPFLSQRAGEEQAFSDVTNSLEIARRDIRYPSGSSYYLYDPAKKHGVWAGRDEPGNPFVIVADNAFSGVVDVRMSDGRLLHLKLREGKIGAVGQGAGSSVAATPEPNSDGSSEEPTPTMTEADKKWEKYREMVAQRRLDRAAAEKAALAQAGHP